MGATFKRLFSGKNKKAEPLKESIFPEKKGKEDKIPDESHSPKKVKDIEQSIMPKEKKETTEIPNTIIEVKVEHNELMVEKNDVMLEKKSENIVTSNSSENIHDDKTSIEQRSGHSSYNKEEEKIKEVANDKKEEIKKNNDEKIERINDLVFPIIKAKKLEESKISECDSLSALNNALSKSQISFYNMNLKIPYNLSNKNISSSQISSEQNLITDSMNNSSLLFNHSYFKNPNPFAKNHLGRKYQQNYNLSHFVSVTLSCSLDTHNVGKYRKKFVQNEKEFFSKIIKIGDVSNIDEFWQFFQHMKKPSHCPPGTDYHVFKKGIVPMWEDNMNKDGGKLSVLLTWKYSNLIWEEVTFNFCKGLLPYYENINGIVISMRPNFVVLSFWINTKNNNIVEKIRYALSNLLQTPSSNCFDFISFN